MCIHYACLFECPFSYYAVSIFKLFIKQPTNKPHIDIWYRPSAFTFFTTRFPCLTPVPSAEHFLVLLNTTAAHRTTPFKSGIEWKRKKTTTTTIRLSSLILLFYLITIFLFILAPRIEWAGDIIYWCLFGVNTICQFGYYTHYIGYLIEHKNNISPFPFMSLILLCNRVRDSNISYTVIEYTNANANANANSNRRSCIQASIRIFSMFWNLVQAGWSVVISKRYKHQNHWQF